MKTILLSLMTGALSSVLGWYYLRLPAQQQRRLLPWVLGIAGVVIVVGLAAMFWALAGYVAATN